MAMKSTKQEKSLFQESTENSLGVVAGSLHEHFLKTLRAAWNSKGSRPLKAHEFTDNQHTDLLTELGKIVEHKDLKNLVESSVRQS